MRNNDVLKRLDEMEQRIVVAMDVPYDVKAACAYLHISESTLYKLVGASKITYHKPGGKLIFYKSDMDAYLRSNRIPSVDEMKVQ